MNNRYLEERNYLRNLLLSGDSRMLIFSEEYQKEMLNAFPLPGSPTSSLFDPPPSYSEKTTEILKDIVAELSKNSDLEGINISDAFDSDEVPEGSIAYHRIWGTIMASAYWYFSTKRFEQDLLRAEANPLFACHFLHISSGGGEAWYLDRISETLNSLSKPVFVLIEKVCGSAAYYIGCHGKVIRALTQNDIVGCIGTMVGFYSFKGYYEQMGIKYIEEYATQSDLKNKKFRDLENGKPKQYIDEELDPLCEQFVQEVKSSRKAIAKLDDKDPVLRGETFSALLSVENGLIDGISTMHEAIQEAHELGKKWLESQHKTREKAYQYI